MKKLFNIVPTLAFLLLTSLAQAQSTFTVTGSSSALDGLVIPLTDVSKFGGITVDLWGTFSATVIFEGLNDRTNASFQPVACIAVGSTSSSTLANSFSASGTYKCSLGVKYFQARISAYTSGTVNGYGLLKDEFPGWQVGSTPSQSVCPSLTGFTLSSAGNPISGTTAFDGSLSPYSVCDGLDCLSVVNTEGYNVGVGSSALAAQTSGYQNTAVGFQSLFSNTTGHQETCVGFKSCRAGSTANSNTALGNLALALSTGGSNVAIGDTTLNSNTTGNNNTCAGTSACSANTTGTYSTGIGSFSLFSNTTGGFNTAVGGGTLQSNTSGTANTAIGVNALFSSTTGTRNSGIGYQDLKAVTTGTDNTALGYNVASATLTTGSRNLYIGTGSYVDAAAAGENDKLNIANILQGSHANANTAGASPTLYLDYVNTAVNYSHFYPSVTGNNVRWVADGTDTDIGLNLEAKGAGFINLQTGPMKMGGWLAHFQDHTNKNVIIGDTGFNASNSQTGGGGNGTLNTALGFGALNAGTTGFKNTALGANSLLVSTTANANTALGYNTLAAATTGADGNTAVGQASAQALTTGSYNTALGTNSLVLETTGTFDTSIGQSSCNKITTGSNNLCLGSGVGSTTLATGQNNILIGTNSNTDTAAAGTNSALNIGNVLKGDMTNVGAASNGALFLQAVTTGVNGLEIDESVTTANPSLKSIGSDSNIGLTITPKGTGALNLSTGLFQLAGNTAHWQDHTNHNATLGETAASATISQTGGGGNGQDITLVGYQAGNANTTGAQNTAMGSLALLTNTTGADNTAVGYKALTLETTGSANNAFGASALQADTTGNNNTAIGQQALNLLTTGTYNVAVGNFSLSKYTTTGFNTGVGSFSLQNGTSGANNAAVGYAALQNSTTAASNSAIGYQAGKTITTGGNNVVIGTQVASTTLTTGTGNILIGVDSSTDAASASTSNTLTIKGVSGGTAVMSTTGLNGAAPLTTDGGPHIHAGTKFTITGCSANTTLGGADTGSFVSQTTGACTVVITIAGATGATAPNGWSCWVNNLTTANLMRQTAYSTTTATVSGTTVTGDLISFGCFGF